MFNKKAEMLIGTGAKILMSVVLGTVLLGGTYTLAGGNVIPNAGAKIVEMFGATSQNSDDVSADANKTIYDDSMVVSKYGRRLIMINKNSIEQKYGVSVEETDVQWFVDGKSVGIGYYYAKSTGEPIEGTVEAVISIPTGVVSDYPNCCTISAVCMN